MRSLAENSFAVSTSVGAPIDVLSRRNLKASFSIPSQLLRALGPSEKPDSGLWSNWLADWGWAWSVKLEACSPELPLVAIWFNQMTWPPNFDPRVLALAVAIRLRVDGVTLSATSGTITFDIERVWRVVSALTQAELGEVLALALLRADSTVFDFNSIAPTWPADVSRVIAERRVLEDEREPAPVWLKDGYKLLGDTFSLLRSTGSTVEKCQAVWDKFACKCAPPMAYEMAYWWEATYCLTERHDYDSAEVTQEKVSALAKTLAGLTGLVDQMWHHQQGRLYYYAGNHELALAEFIREYETHGEDLKVAAMLSREIANVLSDMACLDAAKTFAEKSISIARAQGQRTELYKSLGRLAEISIKLGCLSVAEKLLLESLSIQEMFDADNRAPAQTLTYLGHVALQNGDHDEACNWYDLADDKDSDKSSMPYIMMGRFAIAAARNNAVELTQLWNSKRDRIDAWSGHQTHVLPAAVCIIAAAQYISSAREKLPIVARFLVENRYVVEAAYLIPELPIDCQSLIKKDVITTLHRWQKTLGSLPLRVKELAGQLNGPSNFAQELRKSTIRDSVSVGATCYPMTLLTTPRL